MLSNEKACSGHFKFKFLDIVAMPVHTSVCVRWLNFYSEKCTLFIYFIIYSYGRNWMRWKEQF